MKSIAVLTSGGDAPGMNAAIRAVTRSALDQNMTVLWRAPGLSGPRQRPDHSADRARGRRHHPGRRHVSRQRALQGVSRGERPLEGAAQSRPARHRGPRRDRRQRLADRRAAARPARLSRGRRRLDDRQRSLRHDVTIGFDTAINVTLEAIDHLRTTGSSHNRAFLVETMGRDCGYIAMMAGLAGGAEVISVPENEVPATRDRRSGCARPMSAARPTPSS